MNTKVTGSEGPNSPRSSGVSSEDRKEITLDAKLASLLAMKDGGLSVPVRQGEGKDVPLDGGKTAKRMQDLAEKTQPKKSMVAGLWEKVKSGVRSFAEFLRIIGPPERISEKGLTALHDEIGKAKRNPAVFLREDNDFSLTMARELKSTVDRRVVAGFMREVRSTEGFSENLSYGFRTANSEEAVVLGRLANSLTDAVLGTPNTPSIASSLPESWMGKLREAAAEINRSDMTQDQKAVALRTLVKSSVFLRFVSPEVTLALGHPAQRSMNVIFLTMVNEGGMEKFSPDLQHVLAALERGFAQRLDGFIAELNLLGQNG